MTFQINVHYSINRIVEAETQFPSYEKLDLLYV